MKIEQATVALVPRTLSHCLDVAVVFFRVHFTALLRLWLAFAIPCCLAGWFLVDWLNLDARAVLALVYFASLPLGVLVIRRTADWSFGEGPQADKKGSEIRIGHAIASGLFLRAVIGIGLLLVAYPLHWLLVLVGLVWCVFPGTWLLVRTSFAAEEICLAPLEHHNDSSPRKRKRMRVGFDDAFVRGAMLLAYCGILCGVLYLTIDGCLWLLFQHATLIDRLDGSFDALSYFWTSPQTVVLSAAVILFVYPLGRLAWFFCYLDMRIRRDCWDMELLMAREAQRLGGAS